MQRGPWNIARDVSWRLRLVAPQVKIVWVDSAYGANWSSGSTGSCT
jgi:hypothetical protein